jgi:hypothetical protein
VKINEEKVFDDHSALEDDGGHKLLPKSTEGPYNQMSKHIW